MKIFIREAFISVLLTVVLIFIISLLITYTSLEERLISPLVIGAVTFSLLFCSFRVTKNKKENGIIYGLSFGGMYMIFLYIISALISFDFSISINSIIMIISGVLGGAIGGILGVNF